MRFGRQHAEKGAKLRLTFIPTGNDTNTGNNKKLGSLITAM